MAAFWLKVIASDHVFYNGNCESLVVPAHDGEVGILPHREAMILAIQEGELPEDIDEVRARQALERAQEQLRQKQSIREYYMSKSSMARALSRLKASQHKGSEYHGL